MIKKIFKYVFYSLLGIILFLVGLFIFLYLSADMGEPDGTVDIDSCVLVDSVTFKSFNGNFIHQNQSGLWEAYLHGKPLERGVAMGVLSKDLLYFQEKAFVDQIRVFVPSDRYLNFLRFLTVIFNRNLGKHVPLEYRQEIYGISQSCTHEYDMIGTPYQRQINYHAAHDIGHTMQEYMLVGCSSFSVWGDKSADSTLLIGRNFDFYVGDDFARNKLVMFVQPDKGYKFASVGWVGMIGVLSGMNEAGLTVTINAAKGSIPTSAAMPISILAREILQYASTIEEAYIIANKRHTFVSESLLIGSAKDGRAVIIEKTPSKIGLYCSNTHQIICTNHYQSNVFKDDVPNIENMKESDSPYRYKRIEQLLAKTKVLTHSDVANILRDRKGIDGIDIGLCSEKSINQSISHHSVIFKPEKGLMWVSTSPWQSGEYICYDLQEIFSSKKINKEITKSEFKIVADSTFIKNDYPNVLAYRSLAKTIKQNMKEHKVVPNDSITKFIASNPEMYYVYDLLGDYYKKTLADNSQAEKMWSKALTKEIPKAAEREYIEKKLKKLRDE